MLSSPSRSGILLFHRTPHHSSVPAEILVAAVRSGGAGQPVGRCAGASPWTRASTVPRWRIVGTAVRGAVLVVTLMAMTNVAVMAQTVPSVARLQDQATNAPIVDFIVEASRRFVMPATWIRAVMQAESAGVVNALSSKGAMGLMQLMPETWQGLRTRYGL